MLELFELPHFITTLYNLFLSLGIDESRAIWLTVISFFYLIISAVTYAHCKLRLKKSLAPLTKKKIKEAFISDLILIGIWIFSGYFFWCILTATSLNTAEIFIEILMNSTLLTGSIIFGCVQYIYKPLYDRACRRYQDYYDNPQSWIEVGQIRVLRLYWQEVIHLVGNENYALARFASFQRTLPEHSSDDILQILLEDTRNKTDDYSRERLINKGGFFLQSKDWKLLLKKVNKNESKALDWLRGIRCYYPGLKDMWVITLAMNWVTHYPSSFDPMTFCDPFEFNEFELDELI